jgi:hypothetical protein
MPAVLRHDTQAPGHYSFAIALLKSPIVASVATPKSNSIQFSSKKVYPIHLLCTDEFVLADFPCYPQIALLHNPQPFASLEIQSSTSGHSSKLYSSES